MSFRVTIKTRIMYFFIATVILLILFNTEVSIFHNLFSKKFILYPTKHLIINLYLYKILLMVPVCFIHELIHAFLFSLYGGKITFKFKGLMLCTVEKSGIAIDRQKYLIILLAPLVIISLISLLLPPWLGGVFFILNIVESSADIYKGINLCILDWNCKIVYKNYGYDVVEY
jgi:hypothetical protein